MNENHSPSTPRQANSRLGTTLNAKYRLDRLLGVGGMASVYAATHRNGSRVAVKMLHGPLSLDPDIRRRFLREGYVANKVNHVGAVQVIDDDEAEDGSAFLVMELLKGESLDVRWERCQRRMDVTEVLAITHELLDALGAAHKSGIVHRDIKPANLFLTVEGNVKVLDFGIARLLEATAGHAHTHTGRAVGTPAFMPPEQALGRTRDIDGQTDLWAVGATMFTLLSGRDVHEAENVSEQVVFAATRPARSVAVVLPELAAQIVHVIDCALSFDKPARWANARAMQAAVAEAHLAALGVPIANSIELLRDAAAESLGPVRSGSPRAFAPTIRSDPSELAPGAPGAGGQVVIDPSSRAITPRAVSGRVMAKDMANDTVASTELRASQLGAAHPTTGGGAFSVGDHGLRPPATLGSESAPRWRSLGLAIALAAGAVIAATALYPRDMPKHVAVEPSSAVSARSPGRDDDLVNPIPIRLSEVPAAPPASSPTVADAEAPSIAPASQKPSANPVAGSVGNAAAKVTPHPVVPGHGTPAVSGPPVASATAAQGGVVVTAPF